jgi:hypothetical protein
MAHAVRKTSGAEQCEYSSRKWCSTAQTVSKPTSSATRLLERLVVDPRLTTAVERPRDRELEEDAELHARGLADRRRLKKG